MEEYRQVKTKFPMWEAARGISMLPETQLAEAGLRLGHKRLSEFTVESFWPKTGSGSPTLRTHFPATCFAVAFVGCKCVFCRRLSDSRSSQTVHILRQGLGVLGVANPEQINARRGQMR